MRNKRGSNQFNLTPNFYGIVLKLDLCGVLKCVNNYGTKHPDLELEKQFTNFCLLQVRVRQLKLISVF